jgi:hypothetical protein
MSKLSLLGFDITKPIKYSNAENTSVIASYGGYEYNVDQQATPIQWAALESDLEDGLIEIGGYVPPLEESLEVMLLNAKESASIRIANYTKRMRLAIAQIYDETMMSDWPIKATIAQAISSGSATDAQKSIFQTEILYRGLGETLEEFTNRVLANASFFQHVSATIGGLDKKVRNAVAMAATPAAVEKALQLGKAEAEEAYNQIMAAKAAAQAKTTS